MGGPDMLDLNEIRAEFATFLAEDPTRFRMDAALAHVVTMAYQRGVADGVIQAQAVSPPLVSHPTP